MEKTMKNFPSNITIKWIDDHKSVLIKADGMSFNLDASHPSYFCVWDDAMKYYKDNNIWRLPTIEQLQVIRKYFNEINGVIEKNNGYKLENSWFWSCDELNEFCAWAVGMYYGHSNIIRKDIGYYVRAVSIY